MIDSSAVVQPDHLFLAKDAELLTSVKSNPGEECSEAVIIRLAPFFKGMVMAFCTLKPHPEKDLGCRFREIRGIAGYAVVICGPGSECAALRRDQIAAELVQRAVIAKFSANPVSEAPHSLGSKLRTIAAQK